MLAVVPPPEFVIGIALSPPRVTSFIKLSALMFTSRSLAMPVLLPISTLLTVSTLLTITVPAPLIAEGICPPTVLWFPLLPLEALEAAKLP